MPKSNHEGEVNSIHISADKIALVLEEEAKIENGKLANISYLAVKLAEMVEEGELQPTT